MVVSNSVLRQFVHRRAAVQRARILDWAARLPQTHKRTLQLRDNALATSIINVSHLQTYCLATRLGECKCCGPAEVCD